MTVGELIAELSKMPQDTLVEVSVSNPKDTAYSDDVSVKLGEGGVTLDGWVASDNDNACAPWAYRDE